MGIKPGAPTVSTRSSVQSERAKARERPITVETTFSSAFFYLNYVFRKRTYEGIVNTV
jgi:hypothetical protein